MVPAGLGVMENGSMVLAPMSHSAAQSALFGLYPSRPQVQILPPWLESIMPERKKHGSKPTRSTSRGAGIGLAP
jgi:hypothetical protein